MPRLILHIGLMKTGTTAIQRFFARNRSVLPAFGVHYPRSNDPRTRGAINHSDLVEAFRHQQANSGAGHPDLGTASEVLQRYLAKARNRHATILSAEGLATLGTEAAQLLAPHREAFDIRVIVFLRRQDEWALSTYREHVVNPNYAEARALGDWLADPAIRAQMDYASLLDAWAAAVGEDALRVLRYPHETPLVPSFIRAADLPVGLMTLPYKAKRVRESVPDEIFLDHLRANGGTPERPALSEAERDTLIGAFQPCNRAVKDRFRPDLNALFGLN